MADAPASAARHVAPRREAWTDGEANEFLFPLAIAFNDVLHILYNALELGISSLECWPGVNNQLKVLVRFLGQRMYRAHVRNRCLQSADADSRRLFTVFPVQVLD